MINFSQLLLTMALVGMTTQALAEFCPSVEQLHNQHQLAGWRLYDLDNGTPLSEARIQEYEKNIRQFALATYYDGAPEGAAMCYYKDASGDDAYHQAYLAKEGLKPDLRRSGWRKINNEDYECAGDIFACVFEKETG